MTGHTVGIVGAGAVGQTVGALLVTAPWCTGVKVLSRTVPAAAGLACDLEDLAVVTGSPAWVSHARGPDELATCDAAVICPRALFTNSARTDVRMAGLAANAPVIVRLARGLKDYRGVVIVVTNPVDVMTRLFAEVAGTNRVFGIGSHTDTARYRIALAHRLRVPLTAVGAHVVGEHGDSAVPCATTLHGHALDLIPDGALADARSRPALINAGIGRTRCGPAGAVLAALTHALGLTDGTLELSTRHRGAWIGVPVQFTAGQPTVALPRLTPDQDTALAAAAAKLDTAYRAAAPYLPRRTAS
ncbi:lactate/malate family dehydrogenase [Streptomyces sp. NBC_01431]|uniref:lactate/malate family dehydrogenase n=1 Tax=Streptomyces sp. NBC_01431 TaxID=2903863 RepID=UPI002E3486EF|nr:lactate dehydrogenase [Streptomyces sp. NBC_01431]